MMKNKLERRAFPFDLEIKADDTTGKFIGHAAVFNQVGEGIFFQEKIDPGAFKKTIKKDDIVALFNHDHNFVLGRNSAGTLKLKEDDIGLKVEITPPDTQWARDLRESLRRGDINGMSFAFIAEEDEWDGDLRTLKRVKLRDVSPVTFPFYEGTDVSARTREDIWNQRKSENKHNPLRLANARSRTILIKKRLLEIRRNS